MPSQWQAQLHSAQAPVVPGVLALRPGRAAQAPAKQPQVKGGTHVHMCWWLTCKTALSCGLMLQWPVFQHRGFILTLVCMQSLVSHTLSGASGRLSSPICSD